MSAKTGRPPKAFVKDHMIGCKVDTELYERLQKFRIEHDMSVSEILIAALTEYLDERERKDKP